MSFSLIIADDELSVRNGLSQLIDWVDLGFEVVGVYTDGDSVIEHLKRNQVDVILSDIVMKNTTGLDIAKYVQKNCRSTTVILLSAHSEFDLAQNAIEYGVKKYFLKPTNLGQIKNYFNHLRSELISTQISDRHIADTNYSAIKLLYFEEIIKMHLCVDNYFNEDVNIKIAWENLYGIQLYKLSVREKGFNEDVLNALNRSLDKVKDLNGKALKIFNNDIYLIILQNEEISRASFDVRNCINMVNQFVTNSISIEKKRIFSDYGTFITFIEQSQVQNRKARDLNDENEILKFIDEFIEQNISKKITIEEISELVHKNATYLGRFFKKHKNEHFVDYVNKIRIEKAKELLIQSDMYIYDICEKVGYTHIKYFYKIFKRIEGLSPTDFRKKNNDRLI